MQWMVNALPFDDPNWEQVLSQADATADADNESQSNSLSEAGKGSLSKSGSKADNKGLSNAASRAFNNSSSNALGKSDGRGTRAPKTQQPINPGQHTNV